jgi:hypothetical protein
VPRPTSSERERKNSRHAELERRELCASVAVEAPWRRGRPEAVCAPTCFACTRAVLFSLRVRMSDAISPELQPALRKVQAELAKHLDEACEAQRDDLSEGSVDELLHLEEELLAAARAADEAVRLRRRIGEHAANDGAAGTAHREHATAAPPPDHEPARVREFRDRGGHAWRVWEVRPGIGRPLSEIHRYLGDYVNGWLAFGRLDNDTRKRLPKFPPDWLRMSDGELEALLPEAVDVPKRKG